MNMGWGMRFDLRSPSFSVPTAELYRAAVEMAVWGEQHGFFSVALSEHHASEDGYCPSPLMVASAIAARTTTLQISIAALVLPLHDPIRIAEDMAVLSQISNGRVSLIVGAGYRPEECDMFGITMDDRVPLLEEGIAVLKQAWTGEEFQYHGRTVRVTPTPVFPPFLLLAGATKGAARRAARIADGFAPVEGSLFAIYEEECARLGKTPIGMAPKPGPQFIHVAEDPDAAWAAIAPHALHETNMYGKWLAGAEGSKVYQQFDDADALRASGNYAVWTPEQMIEHVRSTGELRLHPLAGGLPPDVAWQSLELIAAKVIPAVSA